MIRLRYKFDEAIICGIKNPTLVIRGWVDNNADFLVVKNNNNCIERKELIKNRAKISTFNYKINLNGNSIVDIYFENKKNLEKVIVVKSNVVKRIINKYRPRGIMINKLKGIFNNPLKKELDFIQQNTFDIKNTELYNRWLEENCSFVPARKYSYNPKISIVMPVYNVPGEYLGYCIDSILNQTYQNFEICIADDCSTNQDTINTLKKYMQKDKRIKVVFRKDNGHISRATNSALELVSGEFVGLMDNDDKLEIHALNEVISVLNDNPNLDFIYTDEDKIDMQEQRSDPHFKSDFAMHSLYGGNYICHFSVIRKKLIDKIGGFRIGYEGAQDFDLFLRLIDNTNKIYHIPKILYHWRMIPGSTAVGGDGAKNYAGEAGKRALEDYFKNKNVKVNIDIVISTQYFVAYIIDKEPKTTVIFVAKTSAENAINAIDRICKDNVYTNFDIIVINDTKLDLMYLESNIVKIVNVEENAILAINNTVNKLTSEYIIFTDENNYYETIDWMYNLIGYASRPETGVIGAKIIGKYDLVRKSGIVLNNKSILLNAFSPTYRDDYGNNGRLLVPYNYTVVANELFALKRDDFISLESSFNYEFSCYDLQLKLDEQDKQNIFIPQVAVKNKFVNSDFEKKQLLLLKEKWKNKLNYDKLYNENLSNINAFRLDKKNEEN